MAQTNDYTDLITSEHQPRQKFMATVSTLIQPVVDQINVLLSMPGQFDLESAKGAQLNVVGEWVGIGRQVVIPKVDYSPDGPTISTSVITSLDDDTYRLLIIAKIAANNWDGTTESLAELLQILFPPESGTLIFVEDNFDMSMTIGISNAIPSITFLSLLFNQYLPIKPSGVRIDWYPVTSEFGSPIFGFDMSNEYVAGFDEGAWGTDDLNVIVTNLYWVSIVGPEANEIATLVNVTLPAATA
ncbi:DUF2612 domain-containing protein [Burkholderia sp. Ac-20384]|uniref:DUF2612 domain-containing protein n=1 Tax=Burkholderia sp. Ac-20384 TaxID=2703902 RepID=UPI00198191D3|nr:DUF2612 domain-containing protein [Burkholderia sp. Ac-20384]MBN3822362.1 DUF2612 domain-containing protein [Burkholderia sp. Ac-20384]